MEKPRRIFAKRPQPFLLLVLRLVRLVLRHLQSRPLGEKPHRIGVAERLDLHNEVDRAAALMAAEAVVNPLVRRDGKRRRFLRVERAQAKQVRALPRQRHILSHHVLDRVSVIQFVQKRRRKRHACLPSSSHLPSGGDENFRICMVLHSPTSQIVRLMPSKSSCGIKSAGSLSGCE